MKKIKSKNLPIIIFFVLLAAILATNYSYIESFFGNSFLKTSTENTRKEDIKKIDLPVSLNNLNVSSAYLAYNFFGPIKEVKNLPDGIEIVLETNEKDLPKFTVQKDTKIFTVDQDKTVTAATVEDLKKGTQVSISTTYDLKTHLWITRTVHIVN